MRCTLILLLAVGCFAEESVIDKQYKVALEKAQAEYDAKEKPLKIEYETKIKAAKIIYINALKVEKEKRTKAGDLDGALAIKEQLATLEKIITEDSKGPDKVVLEKLLINTRWKYIWDNSKPLACNKPLKFANNGKILMGCDAEATWRWTANNSLEILNDKSDVFMRFVYNQEQRSWVHHSGQTDTVASDREALLLFPTTGK